MMASSSSSSAGSSDRSLSSSSSSSSASGDEDNNSVCSIDETPESVCLWKKQYQDGKRSLVQAIRINETLKEELKRYQRRLLTINQDKYFLFERLLVYEKPQASRRPKASDPEAQNNGTDHHREEVAKKRGPKPKRKHQEEDVLQPDEDTSSGPPASSSQSGQSLLKKRRIKKAIPAAPSPEDIVKFSSGFSKPVKNRALVAPANSASGKSMKSSGEMTRYDLGDESIDVDVLYRETAKASVDTVPDQLFDDNDRF